MYSYYEQKGLANIYCFFKLVKKDNTFGSIRLCEFVKSTFRIGYSLFKITMTLGVQSKISVCLSVIRGHTRSKASHSDRSHLIHQYPRTQLPPPIGG